MTRYRICLVGATGVGKTSIVRQLVSNEFVYQHAQTQKMETFEVIMNIDGEDCIVTLEDTRGIDEEEDVDVILKEPLFFQREASGEEHANDNEEASESDPLLSSSKSAPAPYPNVSAKGSGDASPVHGFIVVYDIENKHTRNRVRRRSTAV